MDHPGCGPGPDFDEDDTGFRGFGGWQFHNNFAVELGYVDGGTASATIGDITTDGIEADVDMDVSGIDLSLLGSMPSSVRTMARAGSSRLR